MLAPPPFTGVQYTSSTDLFVACQQFTLTEGYFINKRSGEEARRRESQAQAAIGSRLVALPKSYVSSTTATASRRGTRTEKLWNL